MKRPSSLRSRARAFASIACLALPFACGGDNFMVRGMIKSAFGGDPATQACIDQCGSSGGVRGLAQCANQCALKTPGADPGVVACIGQCDFATGADAVKVCTNECMKQGPAGASANAGENSSPDAPARAGASSGGGCKVDMDCKGDRICEGGSCVAPH